MTILFITSRTHTETPDRLTHTCNNTLCNACSVGIDANACIQKHWSLNTSLTALEAAKELQRPMSFTLQLVWHTQCNSKSHSRRKENHKLDLSWEKSQQWHKLCWDFSSPQSEVLHICAPHLKFIFLQRRFRRQSYISSKSPELWKSNPWAMQFSSGLWSMPSILCYRFP